MHRSLARFGWVVVACNVAVILLGGLVRATGSGAGCGRSWPTCQGEILPALEGATAVEFTHRAASGLALVLVGILVYRVMRRVPPPHPARTGAVVSGVAIVIEALIGAAIVAFEWVADDASVARVLSVPLHLLNTFVLLAALTLTAHWLGGAPRLEPSRHPATFRWLLAGTGAFLVVAATGAVTALADTLFPVSASVGGEAHFLTDLRIVHPVVAVAMVVGAWVGSARASLPMDGPARWMVLLVSAQLLSGLVSISFGVPIWLQLVHLALADALWVAYVLFAARMLAAEPAMVASG